MSPLPFYPHGMNPLLWLLVYLPSLFFFYVGKVYLSLFVFVLSPRMSKRKLYKPYLVRPSSIKRTLHRKNDPCCDDNSVDKPSAREPSYWFKVAKYQAEEERRNKK